MTDHSNSTNIHIIHAFTFADASARVGAIGLVAADVGKVAKQTDDNSYWILIDTTPTWTDITTAGTGTVGGPVASTDNAIARWNGTSGIILKDSDVFVDDNGNLGIGTSTPAHELTLVQEGPSGTFEMQNYSNSPGHSPRIQMVTSRGTEASPIAVQDGDTLGLWNVRSQSQPGGDDLAARVTWRADGPVTTNGSPTVVEWDVLNSSYIITRMMNLGPDNVEFPVPVLLSSGGSTGLAARIPLNVVEIHTEADWNTASLDGVEFRIMAPLTLTAGSEKVLPTGNWRITGNREINPITYTGISTLFTGTNVGNGQLRHLQLLNTGSGTLFGAIGNSSAHIFLFEVDIDGWADVGTLTSWNLTGINFSVVTNNAAGFKFVNCANNFAATATWFNTVDSFEPLVTFTGAGTQTLTYSNMTIIPIGTETAFSIDDVVGIRAVLTDINGIPAGTMFTAGKLDQTDIKVSSNHNQNQASSRAIGSVFVRENTNLTTINTINVNEDLDLGTAVAGSNIERFSLTDAVTGELTYTGIEPFSGIVNVNAAVLADAGSPEYHIRVVKNGLILPDDMDMAVETPDALSTIPVSLLVPITLVTGDTIRVQVRNSDNTNDLTVNHFSMSIQ